MLQHSLCVSVAPSLINPRHLSQFNMDNLSHLFSFPPSLFFSLICQPPSIFRLSLQSHMKAYLTYACQRNILHHEDRGERERRLPDEPGEHTQTHTCTITPTSSHCMGQSGSLKMRYWSLFLSSGGLSVEDSLLWEPASTQTHHVCMCMYFFFLF